MKAFIQAGRDGLPFSHNFFSAYQGFREMGFETVFFKRIEELQRSKKEDVIVGFVDEVRARLKDFGIVAPEIDYPEELCSYLGRRIWRSKINYVSAHSELWPIFVKPMEDKRFNGIVVRSPKDLIGCGSFEEDIDVFCSNFVSFHAEWRVFVRYGCILDVRPYKGDWRLSFDHQVIEAAVKDYPDAPAGYAMDFGVTDQGETLLIEVNDGYALGSYGLYYLDYAKLLSARWAELTETVDECSF